MIRVAVVARSAVLRSGLEALLGGSAALVVVGSVGEARRSGDDVVPLAELVAPLAPDVVVWVPEGDGTAAALAPLRADDGGAPSTGTERGAARARPAAVLLVDVGDPRAAVAALRAGARAVLPREAGADEIVAAVEAVAAGLVVVPAELADELLAGAEAELPVGAPPAPPALLSPREREVLALLAQGLANKAIAPRLGISEHTVKAHVASIFEKLHAGTRAEAVVTAARQGLLML
ncbi:MAG: response regulator transcription factor [Gemmatirosa sp.]|nr:response regulator transcription factor [Gemmatirosa sp.]